MVTTTKPIEGHLHGERKRRTLRRDLIGATKAAASSVPWMGIGGTILWGSGAGICAIVAADFFLAGAGLLGFLLGVFYIGCAGACLYMVALSWSGSMF